ncbi:DUF5518 domain-containing protein [Halopenitus sp. H-Gu1]|uniref:DUF5518 domain-containing protein n=1 Tax=Halopenitus sp. H-Gu1 TaxID=3242697 RepID=UPI00359DA27D
MPSPINVRTLSTPWRFALIGAVASLPVAGVLNWLPNSEATIGGSIMVIGAFIAGAFAEIRSGDSGAAGLRAGFIGGVLAVLLFVITVVSTAANGMMGGWPLSRFIFWAFACGLFLCVAPIFGFGFGRVGGWVVNTVTSLWTTETNRS